MLSTRLALRAGHRALRGTAVAAQTNAGLIPNTDVRTKARYHTKRTIATSVTKGWTSRQKAQVAPSSTNNNSTGARILNATPCNEEWMLEVTWEEGNSTKYPYIWLRDNCQCPNCFHQTSYSRTVLLKDLDLSLTPTTIQVSEDSSKLQIEWSNGHLGYYTSNWLHTRAFTKEKREKRQQTKRLSQITWGADFVSQIPRLKYSDILEKDEALYQLVVSLERVGVAIVEDAPRHRGVLHKITERRIGYLKKTQYGETFIVKSKADPINQAYTSSFLPLHTDLPYLQTQPEIQLLHCIDQVETEGGDNNLVDSIRAANQLRERYPEKFEILANTVVDFIDVGEEHNDPFYIMGQHSTIMLDHKGNIEGVAISQMGRDSYFDIPVEKVRDWYDAMLTFSKFLDHPDNVINFKLKDGDILIFDNFRIMHGRNAYKMTKEGSRELEGGYWDWDRVRSLRRVLQGELGKTGN